MLRCRSFALTTRTTPGSPTIATCPITELLHRQGLFVAEGRLVVRRLIEAPRFATRSVMVTDTALVPLQDLLDTRQDAAGLSSCRRR